MSNKLFTFIFAFSVAFASFSIASTLEIYNDGAKYRYVPIDKYIGFTRGVSASCEDQSVALAATDDCSDKKRLCRDIAVIKELGSQRVALKYESSTLEQLVTISKPTDIDASKWIDAAQKIGKRKSELSQALRDVNSKMKTASGKFTRQAPAKKAMMSEEKCLGELELNIPAGYIGAKLLYEADVSSPDSISIKQYIALSNHSGIDIVAGEAYIYAKSSRLYLRPQHFSPWVARVGDTNRYAKKLSRSLSANTASITQDAMMESIMEDEGIAMPVPAIGAVVQAGYKNYHISGIELPSTGKDIKVKIADYKVSMECEYIAHPYRDNRLYRTCSFAPSSAIEANKWTIKKNKRLVTQEAYGEYWDGKYLLNTDVDDEVLISRGQVVKKDQSSGIFGGSIRKRDGFEIDVTNISDKPKSIKIIERIPSSTTDKIKVKLVSVAGVNSYKLVKDGKLVIDVNLKPKEHKKIKVIFELGYDKKLKVNY